MRNPGGYATLVDPERGTAKHDTATCQHCSKLVLVPHGELPEHRVMGRCFYCWDEKRPLSGLICADCVRKGFCPRERRKIEHAATKARFVSEWLS